MKALVDSFVSRSFNKKVADDMEAQRLTIEMLQAFYRREHETVASLAGRGARFTTEMLQVAVGFRDPNLSRICLDAGVRPNEAMVKFTADCRDAPLTEMLLKQLPASEKLRDYVAVSRRPKEHEPEPEHQLG